MSDFRVALLSGAAAGTAVDVSLFPLDTIKTRLQSEAGFFKSGGFRGVYAGLPSVLIGSAPGAALFFCSYELVKTQSGKVIGKKWEPVSHMLAASVGEVSACLIRVPVEVVKQRAQTLPHLSSLSILSSTLKDEGLRGLYRGYMSTVLREVPFSLIQFPLWEYFKKRWSGFQGYPVDPWQSSVCGAVAGAISSAITTPTDVAKTRIMLAKSGSPLSQGSIVYALPHVYSEKGIRGLFAGIVPRVVWITIGGAIFLGIYDKSKAVLTSYNMAY